LYVVTKTPTPS